MMCSHCRSQAKPRNESGGVSCVLYRRVFEPFVSGILGHDLKVDNVCLVVFGYLLLSAFVL